MGIFKLKVQSIQKKFIKELQNSQDTRTPNSKIVHSVGILTTEELTFQMNVVKKVDEQLESVRNIHIYNYRKYDKNDPKSYKHFSENDISWSGKFTDVSLESFLETPFDLLIGFYTENNLYLEYATLMSKATFKVGFAGVNNKLFDLVITEKPENIDSFLHEIVKYLTLLKKM